MDAKAGQASAKQADTQIDTEISKKANGIHHGVVSIRLSCKHFQNTYLRIYQSVLQIYIRLCSTHMKTIICNENNYLQGTDIGKAQGGSEEPWQKGNAFDSGAESI